MERSYCDGFVHLSVSTITLRSRRYGDEVKSLKYLNFGFDHFRCSLGPGFQKSSLF